MPSPEAVFDPSAYAGKPKASLDSPVTCHILQIVNVTESKEKALEDWKYYHNPNTALFERMEHVNRPVIYGIDLDATENDPKPHTQKATYKLLLRDLAENYFYALELEDLPFLHPRDKNADNPLPIPLGGRLLLQRGTQVSDGIVLLKRSSCTFLGPDPGPLASQLNGDIVEKHIEILEKQLAALKQQSAA